MNRSEFEQAVADWVADEMPAGRRAEFEAWLEQNPAFETEARDLQRVWNDLAVESDLPDLKARWQPHFEAALAQPAASPLRQQGWAIAATLVVGIAIGSLLPRADGELSQVRDELKGLQGAMAANLVRMESAGDRLAGVALAAQLASARPEFRQTLIDLVRTDTNLNVRLAAMDALVQRGFADDVSYQSLNLEPDDPFAQWLPSLDQADSTQEL